MPPELHLDPARLDLTRILADQKAIQKINPQRFEMEHLTAIVYEDTINHIVAGYKDVRADEFWVRGHLPGFPLLPGVVMCEAAAQLCSFYIGTHNLMPGSFIGFGGMDDVRFRSKVYVGDRLVLIAKALKIHRRKSHFNVQGFVGSAMAFHADILGMPMAQNEGA
jgi:3-hydroxyacyl-[acyl-carrier-protein] dehydratase